MVLGMKGHGKSYEAAQLSIDTLFVDNPIAMHDFSNVFVLCCDNIGIWAETNANFRQISSMADLRNVVAELGKVEGEISIVLEGLTSLARIALDEITEGAPAQQQHWGLMSANVVTLLAKMRDIAETFIVTTLVTVGDDGKRGIALNPFLLNNSMSLFPDVHLAVQYRNGSHILVDNMADAISLNVPKMPVDKKK